MFNAGRQGKSSHRHLLAEELRRTERPARPCAHAESATIRHGHSDHRRKVQRTPRRRGLATMQRLSKKQPLQRGCFGIIIKTYA